MAELPRKAIPVEVKCRVILYQLGTMTYKRQQLWIEKHRRNLGAMLKAVLLPLMAEFQGCEVAQLRLDHNPALGIRKKIIRYGVIVGYEPHEHDPSCLLYRSAHDHHIKTNVRGDGAQFSDTVLMKRERRRQKREVEAKRPTKQAKKSTWPKGQKIRSRGFEGKRK